MCIQRHHQRLKCNGVLPSKHGLEANAIVVLPTTIKLAPVGITFAPFIAVVLVTGSGNAASGLPLLLRVYALLLFNLTILSMVGVGQKLWPCLLEEGMVFCCQQTLQLCLQRKEITTARTSQLIASLMTYWFTC